MLSVRCPNISDSRPVAARLWSSICHSRSLRVYESLGEEGVLPVPCIYMWNARAVAENLHSVVQAGQAHLSRYLGSDRRANHPTSAGIAAVARAGAASSFQSTDSPRTVLFRLGYGGRHAGGGPPPAKNRARIQGGEQKRIRTRGILVPNDIIGDWRDRIGGLVRPPAKRLRG